MAIVDRGRGSGGIALLLARGIASSSIISFRLAASAAIVVLIVVFATVAAVVGAAASFVGVGAAVGDATRRSLISIDSNAFWMVCGLWMGELSGI